MRFALLLLILGLVACRRELPRRIDPASSVSSVLSASASAPAPEPPSIPAASAVVEIPTADAGRSEAEVVVERFLSTPSDDDAKNAVKRVLRGMCVAPGRRDLQGIVAAHLAVGEPPSNGPDAAWFRRRNALHLLQPCLDAHLDGPYVDVVIAQHRAELAHREEEAILGLDALVGLRPGLRPELERWARLHAPLPASPPDCHARNGLAWDLLVHLRLLREGMPIAEAVAILGPGNVDAATGDHSWYASTSCHVNRALTLETHGGLVRRIRFGSR